MIGSFRFMLAVFVVISHTKGYPFEKLPDPALSAIVAFFFLSGYLMPATLEQNYGGASFAARSVRYIVNRFLRIYPVYWLALILAFAALWYNEEARSLYYFNTRSIIQNFVLFGLNQSEFWHYDLRFIGPAWTLDVELQYYVLVPALVLAARFAPKFVVTLMVAAGTFGVHLLIYPTGRDEIDRSLLTWCPFFAAGFLCFWYQKEILARVRVTTIFWFGAFLSLLSLVLAPMLRAASHWVFAIALIVFAARLLLGRKRQSITDRFLGDLSYPVFVLHAVVNSSGLPASIANTLAPGSVPVLTLVTLSLTIPLCVAVEFVISKPIDRLRQKLRRSNSGESGLVSSELRSPTHSDIALVQSASP